MISLARYRSVVFLALAGSLTLSPLASAAPRPALDLAETLWQFLAQQIRPAEVSKEGCQTNPDGKPCPTIVTPPPAPPAKPTRPRPVVRRTSPVGALGAP